ncbi:MAG TPA: discoidin domain-containing protein [Opitutaceae bacterium]|jgi:hypothetical protein|nr:discoidin domain-containing protein [Opitutaceae bacterium]
MSWKSPSSYLRLKLLAAFIGFAFGAMLRADDAHSTWVYPGTDGHLVYKTTAAGDRIIDFSSAGYRGGGVALPVVPVVQTVQPSGGADDTDAIQAAIDAVAARPLQDGFRGTVLLGPGTFTCAKTIELNASGVVLRGSGSMEAGTATTIRMTGEKHVAIGIGGKSQTNPPKHGPRTTITDAYVPAGANHFSVANAAHLAVGDTILIQRPATPAWVKFMGMDDLVRTGQPESWLGQLPSGITRRTITGISGHEITCDLPLTDSYDARYLNPPGTTVIKIVPPPAIADMGVENLHIQCPPLEIDFTKAPYSAIDIFADDCWVKDVFCDETINSTTLEGNRITLAHVVVKHTYPNCGTAKPSDFSIQGSQILIDRCEVTGDNEYFVWTKGRERGPNVVLNSVFRGRGSRIQPHERWSTGFLVDNCTVPDGGIDFMNRGVAGSGHGWTIGWAVAWNCVANNYLIQNPPGSDNWSIGCIGTLMHQPRMFAAGPVLPDGIVESAGTPVAPQSLYLAQLADRLGPQAVVAIGYPGNAVKYFAGKSTPRLPAYVDVDPVLGPNLASHCAVDTSSVRGDSPEFGGERALDKDPTNYWATADGAVPAMLDLDLEGPVPMNTIVLEEAPGSGHRVLSYKVEGMINDDWTLLAQGTTIGDHVVDRFPTQKIWKIRLTVLDAEGYVALRKLGLYLAPGTKQVMSEAK